MNFMKSKIQVERRVNNVYRAVFNATQNAVIIIDLNSLQIYDANPRALNLFNYTFEEIINLTFSDISCESNFAIQDEITENLLKYYKRKDGTSFPVKEIISKFNFENTELALVVLEDLTATIAAHEALAASEVKYKTILDNTKDIVYTFDQDGILTYISPSVKIFGYSVDEVVGKNLIDFIYSEDKEYIFNAYTNMLKTGENYTTKFRIITKSGNYMWVEENGEAVRNINSDVISVVGVMRDITDRQIIEDKLESAKLDYKRLYDTAPVAIYQIDFGTGKFLKANEHMCSIIGCTQEEVTNHSIFEVITDRSKNYYSEILEKIEDDARPEIEIVDKSTSEIRWLQLNNKFIYDSEGKVIGADVIAHDITTQKLAEQKLKNQMNFVTSLIETIPGPVFYKDVSGKYLGCNAAFEKHFGIKREDLIGKTAFEVWAPHIAELYSNSDKKLLNNPEVPYLYDGLSVIPNTNEVRNIIVNKAVYHDTSGNVAGIVGVVTDITERKRIMEALAASEAKYKAIVEDQTELICHFTTDGILTFVNTAYCNYFGKNAEDLIGKPFIDLIPDEDKEFVKQSFQSINKDKPYNHYDHKVIASNGEIRWMHWSDRAIFDEEGNIKEYQSIGFDITDRKNLEIDLRNSKNKYRAILDTLQDGFYQTDKHGNIRFVSNSALELLGYTSRNEVIGKPISTVFLDPLDRERFIKRLKDAGGKLYDQELNLVNVNGDIITVSLNCQIVYDEFGNFDGTQGMIRNITETKHRLSEITKLYNVVEGSQTGLIIIELDGTISYANNAMLRIAKSPDWVTIENHVLGRKAKAFLSFDEPLQLSDICQIVECEGKWLGSAYIFCACSEHERVPIDVMFSRINDDENGSYIVASFTDTTERQLLTKKIHEQSRMYEELQQSMMDLVSQMELLKVSKEEDISKLEREFFESIKIIESNESGGANIDDTNS